MSEQMKIRISNSTGLAMLTKVEDIATGRILPVRKMDIHMDIATGIVLATLELVIEEFDVTTEAVKISAIMPHNYDFKGKPD